MLLDEEVVMNAAVLGHTPALHVPLLRAVCIVVVVGLALSLCPCAVFGQCINYGDYLRWVGGIGISGSAWVFDQFGCDCYSFYPARALVPDDCAVDLTRLWCGAAGCPRGSLIGMCDVTDRASPQLTASLDFGGAHCEDIAAPGDYVYLVSPEEIRK